MAGAVWRLRDLIARVGEGSWQVVAATYGSSPQAMLGTLVIGRGLPVTAAHQANPGSRRAWAKQQAARRKGLSVGAQQTDTWMLFFTTHRHWRPAVQSYRRRWATEGSYRDAQSGWDGRHGWDLDHSVARLTDAGAVGRVLGLWALGTLLQSAIGAAVGRADAPPAIQAVVAEWTTTGRLSVWARGHLALSDPSGRLHRFLCDALRTTAAQFAAAPPLTTAAPPLLPRRPPPKPTEAA